MSQQPRPRRHDTINMDGNVIEIVLNDIKAFLLEKPFYCERACRIGVVIFTMKLGVLLLEDIDAAGLANRDLDPDPDLSMMSNDEIKRGGFGGTAPKEPAMARLVEPPSLDVVLNVLDGVSSDEGRLVIMTTNRPDALDDALISRGAST
ncbi:hypothetical protein PG994_009891 [Apiospora phragmitis]|uniref:ATPase AAA-type core domain-containing protein n=1 Tax=Apiospora phragmitis TaxID=2905665 RepID=A0ABR1TNB8_9PEZI